MTNEQINDGGPAFPVPNTYHPNEVERERDEARKDLEFRRDLYKVQEGYLEEAREKAERYRLQANSFMLKLDEARNELLKCNEYNDELYRKLKTK